MKAEYKYTVSSSSFSLSFYTDEDEPKWSRNGKSVNQLMTKTELPQNSLFNITSLVFDIQTRTDEVQNKYNCFYHPSQEALCIVLTSSFNYLSLSKCDMINLIDFAKKIKIKSIIVLIDRKCRDYVRILQGMMLIGFMPEKEKKMANIEGRSYRVLSMNMKDQVDHIEEIEF